MSSDTSEALQNSTASCCDNSVDQQCTNSKCQPKQVTTADVEVTKDISHTPLMLAIIAEDISKTHTLVNERTDLRKQDSKGMTALMHAANRGYLEGVKLLIEHEWGIQDINGMTALMYAVQAKKVEVIELLAIYEGDMMDGEGRTATDLAIEINDAALVNVILEAMGT